MGAPAPQDRFDQVVVHLQPEDLVLIILLHLAIGFVVPDVQKIEDPDNEGEDEQSLLVREGHASGQLEPDRDGAENGEPEKGPPDLDHDGVDRAEEEDLFMEQGWDMIVQDIEIEALGLGIIHQLHVLHHARLGCQVFARLILLKGLPPFRGLSCIHHEAGGQCESGKQQDRRERPGIMVHVPAEEGDIEQGGEEGKEESRNQDADPFVRGKGSRRSGVRIKEILFPGHREDEG